MIDQIKEAINLKKQELIETRMMIANLQSANPKTIGKYFKLNQELEGLEKQLLFTIMAETIDDLMAETINNILSIEQQTKPERRSNMKTTKTKAKKKTAKKKTKK